MKTMPIWIQEMTVLKIHDAQLAEHGGSTGIRDQGLLDSALHHPINLFSYGSPNLFELAAAYAERIAKNHPFIDGNKRTAYVVMLLFLRLNGFDLIAPREERVIKMVELASSKITVEQFVNWLKENTKLIPKK